MASPNQTPAIVNSFDPEEEVAEAIGSGDACPDETSDVFDACDESLEAAPPSLGFAHPINKLETMIAVSKRVSEFELVAIVL